MGFVDHNRADDIQDEEEFEDDTCDDEDLRALFAFNREDYHVDDIGPAGHEHIDIR